MRPTRASLQTMIDYLRVGEDGERFFLPVGLDVRGEVGERIARETPDLPSRWNNYHPVKKIIV
jgi:hypothetical protein